ncbi:hypothetical protein T11_2816 [Trichinella zimbabwensis]|uniref:Uncharacterized protein n=1 Tax=Trichinella zimbabwensis TaxID=268475 RepID=A0A0V1HAE8_9BILA|nr:hypothetical protein T11_2816 [Trichinella zimbabwensis]
MSTPSSAKGVINSQQSWTAMIHKTPDYLGGGITFTTEGGGSNHEEI